MSKQRLAIILGTLNPYKHPCLHRALISMQQRIIKQTPTGHVPFSKADKVNAYYEANKETVRKLIKEGADDALIAKTLKTTTATVRGIRGKCGIDNPNNPTFTHPAWFSKMKELLLQGYGKGEIAKTLKITSQAVEYRLQHHPDLMECARHPVWYDGFKRMISEGASYADMMRVYDISCPILMSRLARFPELGRPRKESKADRCRRVRREEKAKRAQQTKQEPTKTQTQIVMENIEKIKRMREEYKNDREIAEEIGVTRYVIKHVVTNRLKMPGRNKTAEAIEEVKRMREEGCTIAEISKSTGRPKWWVTKIVQKLNI